MSLVFEQLKFLTHLKLAVHIVFMLKFQTHLKLAIYMYKVFKPIWNWPYT